ncbi:MAG: DEAD/DEAH box helicase [Campylobacterota bacterium]
MTNIIEVNYDQTGQSKSTNKYGMRQMQEKAYENKDAQYLLLKAPPASGKSRALMFIALDKLINQGLKKVIVAVPEKSIGSSFGTTDLKSYGFYADWEPNEEYNLCTNSSEKSKVEAFKRFLKSEEKILICTHSTLRNAFAGLKDENFDNVLLAIDEFHHVSADGENRLGELIRTIMENSSAHIVAMTGSYFRGDSVPVLEAKDEISFEKVTYNYYEQLNGYEYLKSLGIGYHFYQGKYLSAIDEVLDTDKKTIIHIPNVNSSESTKDKYKEVGQIIDLVGKVVDVTDDGVHIVKRDSDGKILKIADLVEDDEKSRTKIDNYLNTHKNIDDMDIIIALGKAKEGFDWTWCEHALTVGYRSSLTEIIQIIGRATRDSDNKTHAQFTNLIAQPNAEDSEVTYAVNDLLKAITASLLMEQVLAPNFKFKPRFKDDEEPSKKGELKIRGFKKPSKEVENIIESDLNELKAKILQDKTLRQIIPMDENPEVINQFYIPKIIRKEYPHLDDTQIEELREYVVVDSVVKGATIEKEGSKEFLKMGNKFLELDKLSIDMIDKINPFQKAFEVISKELNKNTFKLVKEAIDSTKIEMSEEEAVERYNRAIKFKENFGRLPDINSHDFEERRMAEAIVFIKSLARKRLNG